MLLKIIFYLIIVIAIYVDGQTIHIIEKLGLSKGYFFSVFLFSIYFILLFMDLRPRLKNKPDFNILKRRALLLSFWIGAIWGVLISGADGFRLYRDPTKFLFSLIGIISVAIFFCIIGHFFLKFLWNRYVPR